MNRTAIVLNDTRRASEHLGCLTVMSNLLRLCAEQGIHVARTIEPVDAMNSAEFHKMLPLSDLVLVNGEGTMHHDAQAALELLRAVKHAKQQGKSTALVNSVWQGNRALNSSLELFDFIAVRDSRSQLELAAGGATAPALAPDLSFWPQTPAPDLPGKGAVPNQVRCVVTDSVFRDLAVLLFDYAAREKLPFRVMVTWSWQEGMSRHPIARSQPLTLAGLLQASCLITGRFHAVCLAMKHGVPFLALPSNTHKVESLFIDAGLPVSDFMLPPEWEHRPAEFWVERAREVYEKHKHTMRKFVISAAQSIQSMFGALRSSLPTQVSSIS